MSRPIAIAFVADAVQPRPIAVEPIPDAVGPSPIATPPPPDAVALPLYVFEEIATDFAPELWLNTQ